MKRITTLLAGLAVALVVGMSIAPAYSYFTDSSTANGGIPIGINPSTTITEKYGSGTKTVKIENSADATTPVYVRARVYTSAKYTVEHGDSWSGPDTKGWYNFANPVAPGAAADDLLVKITLPDEDAIKSSGIEFGDNFNVIVVYESTPVKYQADGTPYADWEIVLDSETTN